MSSEPSGEGRLCRACLKKSEILRHQRAISALFEAGRKIQVPYLQVFFRVSPPCSAAKVMVLFSVSRRRIKRATARNRIKRLLREAYRLQKWHLLDALSEKLGPEQQLHLALLYHPQRQPLTLERATKAILQVFEKIVQQL